MRIWLMNDNDDDDDEWNDNAEWMKWQWITRLSRNDEKRYTDDFRIRCDCRWMMIKCRTIWWIKVKPPSLQMRDWSEAKR